MYHGPTDAFGFPIGTLDDQYEICIVVNLEEYYDDQGDFGFRPSRETVEHPNGRGRVEKRVLQASLLQELRSFNLVVHVVRSRAGNKNYFLIRAPTLAEWAKKVWVPIKTGESDCRSHIPRARPRVFAEKCVNTDRDKRLRDMGIELTDKDARTADPDFAIHDVQVLMSWYDYWADKYKVKYLCREHEKGFRNFYLPFEFNEKNFYEHEAEHNLVYDGALVTLEELEAEIASSGEMRNVAGKILTQLRKDGKWWPPEKRYGANYILNPERIDEKAKWAIEGRIYDAEAQIKLKSDLQRFEEANELRRAQERQELTKTMELRNRKVWQSRYEIYKENKVKEGVFSDALLSQDKWLEHLVIQNAMRATSVRIELLMRVIEEACKRRIAVQRNEDVDDVNAEDTGGLLNADDKTAQLDAEKDTKAQQGKGNTKRVDRDLAAHEASQGTASSSAVDMYLTQLLQHGVIETQFPLHQKEGRRWLSDHWAHVPLSRLLLSSSFWLARSPVDEIRDYFGEEEAFYFAWLGLYTRMLYIPSAVGLLTQLWNINNGSINDSIVVPFFCAFIALWAISFNNLWKRQEAELAHRWGMANSGDQDLDEQTRPEFVGTPNLNPYTEETEMTRTSGFVWEHVFKLFYVVAAAICIAYGLGMLSYQHTIRTAFGFPEESTGAFFWFHLSIGLLSTVGILILDELYSHVALWFANKENHRTDKDYDRATASKLLSFFLLSANITLFHTAFWGYPCRPRDQADLSIIQQHCTGFASTAFNSQFVVPQQIGAWDYVTGQVLFSNKSTSSFSNGTDMETMNNIKNPCWKKSSQQTLYCQLGSQMSLLGVQLGILFGLWQGLSLFFELVVPWLRRTARRRAEAKILNQQGLSISSAKKKPWANESSTNLSGAAAGESQAGKERLLSSDNKGFRYVKLVVQFAYITLFANAFPVASCFALINNICQVRVDAHKLVLQARRPRPQPASGIGLYASIMNMLCFVGIVVNALILGITSSSMGSLYEAFQWKVGQDLDEVWRYNICSADARATITSSEMTDSSERHVIHFEEGICLPLQSFYRNNLNGFPPGEEAHEQTYSFLWTMIIMEHIILAILYVIEIIIPDASATTVNERKGQSEWLRKRAAKVSEGVHIEADRMRGRFSHAELTNVLSDTRIIEYEIEIAKLESDFNSSTGFPKASHAKPNFEDNVKGLGMYI